MNKYQVKLKDNTQQSIADDVNMILESYDESTLVSTFSEDLEKFMHSIKTDIYNYGAQHTKDDVETREHAEKVANYMKAKISKIYEKNKEDEKKMSVFSHIYTSLGYEKINNAMRKKTLWI